MSATNLVFANQDNGSILEEQHASKPNFDNIKQSETMQTAHSIHDPIIQTILLERKHMDDVSLEDELERQKRMYVMLRHSKKYRKIQVQEANKLWGEDLENALLQGSSSSCLGSRESGINVDSCVGSLEGLENLLQEQMNDELRLSEEFRIQENETSMTAHNALNHVQIFNSTPPSSSPPTFSLLSGILHSGEDVVCPLNSSNRTRRRTSSVNKVSFDEQVYNIPSSQVAFSEESLSQSRESQLNKYESSPINSIDSLSSTSDSSATCCSQTQLSNSSSLIKSNQNIETSIENCNHSSLDLKENHNSNDTFEINLNRTKLFNDESNLKSDQFIKLHVQSKDKKNKSGFHIMMDKPSSPVQKSNSHNSLFLSQYEDTKCQKSISTPFKSQSFNTDILQRQNSINWKQFDREESAYQEDDLSHRDQYTSSRSSYSNKAESIGKHKKLQIAFRNFKKLFS